MKLPPPNPASIGTEATEIKQALAQRGERAEAPHIYEALELHRSQLERKVPTGVLTYGFAEAALLTELRNTPKLREIDPAKVLGAFSAGLQLGLVPGPLDLIHFIPHAGEVVVVVGYRGKLELVYRSGLVKDVSVELVYDGDTDGKGKPWRVMGGTSPAILHQIAPPGKRAIVAAYAVAHLKTGGTVFRVIYEEDWEDARAASQLGAKNKGPWAEHRPAMIRKTALHRLADLLPKSPESAFADTVDEQPAEPVADVLEGE